MKTLSKQEVIRKCGQILLMQQGIESGKLHLSRDELLDVTANASSVLNVLEKRNFVQKYPHLVEQMIDASSFFDELANNIV